MDQVLAASERACSDALALELAKIPSTLGRLARVAVCRDVQTGLYRDERLFETHGPSIAARTLRHFHENLFWDWLLLPMPCQHGDVEAFLKDPITPEWGILIHAPSDQYSWLIPDGALEAERCLFLTDLGELLSLHTRDHQHVTSETRRNDLVLSGQSV